MENLAKLNDAIARGLKTLKAFYLKPPFKIAIQSNVNKLKSFKNVRL